VVVNEVMASNRTMKADRRVRSTVTVTISALERHGYLRQFPCETDARITYVQLTPKGRGLRKDFEEISRALWSKLYGNMSENHRERLVTQLDEIEENLSK
jgi:DNA-binding MarR family transcriptional regulator